LSGQYCAHSLRSSFATEAGRQGISLLEVMAPTGHASVSAAVAYHHAGGILQVRVSRRLDTPSGVPESGLANS
jgi:site-specific recombinase XerD